MIIGKIAEEITKASRGIIQIKIELFNMMGACCRTGRTTAFELGLSFPITGLDNVRLKKGYRQKRNINNCTDPFGVD